jgi:murein L,D-transpeptidase YafK
MLIVIGLMRLKKFVFFLVFVSFLHSVADAQSRAAHLQNGAAAANRAEGEKLFDPTPVKPPTGLVPENFIMVGTSELRPKHIFIADKQNRTLTVWEQKVDTPVLYDTYPMDIGKYQGDKLAAGDHRTPEGIYFFQERYEGANLDFQQYGIRAFTLDYPNFFDISAGKTGSGIWLHAVPDTTSLMRGSRGCVVVRNEIIDKLTPLINLKTTPMLILDKVNYVSPEKLMSRRSALQSWLQNWQTAWQSKNIDEYISHYSDDFKAMKMNKEQWRRYKESLNQKYNYIKVSVEAPFLVTKQNEAVISFNQNYESDSLKDLGHKTLYVKQREDNKFEILTEVWKPLSPDLLAQKALSN